MKPIVNHEIGSTPDGIPTSSFYTPSRFKVTVREQNGADDDILTKMKDNKDGTAMHKYIAQIITECEGYTKPLTSEDIAKWKVRDKYYVVYKSRRFSLGDELTFDHLFEGDIIPHNFTEDLGKYDWDFSKDKNPKTKGEDGYDPNIFQPYPLEVKEYAPELTLVRRSTQNEWKIRYKYLTGVAEREALGMNIEEMAINDKLRLREIELSRTSNAWQSIEVFDMLSADEMRQIRTHLALHDPDFNMTTEVKNPLTGAKEKPGIMQVDGFFFPAG